MIYTFFQLLVTYLGGERSLLIVLHGRPPISHPFPFNIFLSPMDVSDPWTLLNLKRGVLRKYSSAQLTVHNSLHGRAMSQANASRVRTSEARSGPRYCHPKSYGNVSRREVRMGLWIHIYQHSIQYQYLPEFIVSPYGIRTISAADGIPAAWPCSGCASLRI